MCCYKIGLQNLTSNDFSKDKSWANPKDLLKVFILKLSVICLFFGMAFGQKNLRSATGYCCYKLKHEEQKRDKIVKQIRFS